MSTFSGIVMDEVTYQNLCITNVERGAQVIDHAGSTRMLDGTMKRRPLGTYYNYTLEVARVTDSAEALSEYDSFYEVITAPVESHTITMPYAQGTASFTAYVTAAKDHIECIQGHKTYWSGLSVQYIACAPKRSA